MLKIAVILVVLLHSIPSFANDVHNLISKKSNTERSVFFNRFLTASGEPCGRVTKTFFQGFDKEQTAYWNVACSNKREYSISIENDSQGTTGIMDCPFLEAIGVECFKKFEK